jgi:hypothetical protein
VPIIETKLANQIWSCICSSALPANGLRYPRVGGRGQCLRCRKSSKPEKCLKMPQTPTRRVHALLGNLPADQNACRKKTPPPTRLTFTYNFDFGNSIKSTTNQNACVSKTLLFKNLTLPKNTQSMG